MQLRNCAEVFRSCRRRRHDDGWGESLCLCCSRDSLEALWNAPQSEMRRGDRQRIPRNESPKMRLFVRGTGGSNPSPSSSESLALRDLSPLRLRQDGNTLSRPGTDGSNPAPSSSQSVSAVNPEAIGEKPRTLAAVCGWLGT